MGTILIVDDNEKVRELVRVTLTGAGEFTVFEAENADDALGIAAREKPDLVLMDVMMPGEIDGYEAVRRLKADPATRDIRVIMLTARGQKSDLELGKKIGAEDYFIKPFSPIALLKKIESIFG